MFEFTTAKGQVTVSDGAVSADWVLNMPKLSERGGRGGCGRRTPAAAPLPAAPGIGPGRAARAAIAADGRGGQGGGQRAGGNFPGRRAGGPGAQGAAGAQAGPGGRGPGRGAPGSRSRDFRVPPCEPRRKASRPTRSSRRRAQTADLGGDADESLLVNGSMSGGLEQSSDDEARRQRAMGGRGGPAVRAVPAVRRAARFRRHKVYR